MTPVQYLQKLIEKAAAHQKKEKFSDCLLKFSGDVVQGANKPIVSTGTNQAHIASSNPIRGTNTRKANSFTTTTKIPDILKTAQGTPPIVPDAINSVKDFSDNINAKAERNKRAESRNREVCGSLIARNTGVADMDGQVYVNGNDVELLSKLGFDLSENEYLGLEKTSEVLDIYSYIEKVAGVPKEVAKLINAGQAFSGEYLKNMGYKLPKGYEVKGDLCCPVEKTEQSFQQTGKKEKESSEKTAASKPGLWANVHAKKARGEKTAKPGDKDYPDSKQWKKLTKAAIAVGQRNS